MRRKKLIGTTGTTGTGTHSLPSKRLAFNKLNLQTTKTKKGLPKFGVMNISLCKST